MTLFLVVLAFISIAWIGYEVWLVYRDRKHNKGGTQIDRGSRYLNFTSLILGISGAAILSGVPAFFFPGGRTEIIFWVGISVMLAGFALRIWSVTTLGGSFRTTIETHAGQKVVKSGPYKLIRHPSYSGLLLMCCGYGLAVQNWLSLAFAVVPPLLALLYRIHVEEIALRASMGPEYQDYQKHTKKIIPWVW